MALPKYADDKKYEVLAIDLQRLNTNTVSSVSSLIKNKQLT